jgi:gluconolactonase
MNSSIDNPKTQYTTITNNYNGKKYNSPNDLIVDTKSNIYFTDPIYGLPEKEKDPTRELSFEGVYRVSTNGKVELLIDTIPRPNGIALSPDEENALYRQQRRYTASLVRLSAKR